MSYLAVQTDAEQHALAIMGGLHQDDTTLLLLGPGPNFWPHFQTSSEAHDGTADPVDRWSHRVINDLARRHAAQAHFPFGGPPYAPFLSWALKTGRAWSSPVGMLVHDTCGLMVSFRGALEFPKRFELPPVPDASPCDSCAEKPCLSSCPVGALGPNGYDTQSCHAFLRQPDGLGCLQEGCIARRSCPVSAGAARTAAQSRHHMSYFHKT